MAKNSPFLPALTDSALFAGLTEKDAQAMLHCLGARAQRFAPGEPILREGDRADRLGLLLSGGAQVTRTDIDGNRSILTDLAPGDLFAEAFAFADVARMPVDVTATAESEVLLLDSERITRTCSNACQFHNKLILNLLGVVAAKNLAMNQKLEITGHRTTRDKLMAYLMAQARQAGSDRFTIPLDRQGLADYLGVERSALSAEIGRLRREGVLESQRSSFRLLGAVR